MKMLLGCHLYTLHMCNPDGDQHINTHAHKHTLAEIESIPTEDLAGGKFARAVDDYCNSLQFRFRISDQVVQGMVGHKSHNTGRLLQF